MDVNEAARHRAREWLLQVAELTKRSLGELAKEAGIAASTLYRVANDRNHRHILSTKTIAKISASTGVPPPATLNDASAQARGFAAAEAEPWRFDRPGFELTDNLIRLAIAGRAGLDPWLLLTRALELAGYLPGDVAILDRNAAPRAGDVVCAQIYDFVSMRAETIWRLYEPPYLVAASADRALLKPMTEQAAVIKGVVVATIRPRPVSRETGKATAAA